MAMTRFLGLDRASLAVRDLEHGVRTYRDLLGLEVVRERQRSSRGFGLQWVELGRDGRTFLELLAPTGPGGPVHRFLERRGEGVYQIRLTTADVRAQVDALSRRGVRTIADPDPGGDLAWIHPSSTHGVLFEIAKDDGDSG